jgi:enoyl-CoA hydratase
MEYHRVNESKTAEVHAEAARPGVHVVVIDRPERRNALSIAVKDRLAAIVAELDANPSVHAIVISGGPAVFVAGTDIEEMAGLTPTEHTLRATDRVFTTIRGCRTPILAAVEGYALGGGCELAMSCDLIIAGENARFGQPEIRVGVMPGAGATQRMVRTIGKFRTLSLLLTGGQFTGREAYAMGLASEVVADGSALNRALDMAETVVGMPPLAVQAILDVVTVGEDAPIETALLLERKAFQLLFDTADQTEGMRAFLEKRSPDFVGE